MKTQGFVLPGRAAALASYPHARRVGDLVFVSGVSSRRSDNSHAGVRIDADGTVHKDIRAQTRAVIENMGVILKAAGTNLGHVVDLTVFLVDMEDYKGMNEVYNTFFNADTGPARTTVAVHQLPHPNLLVEIKIIATMPEENTAMNIDLDRISDAAQLLWTSAEDKSPISPLTQKFSGLNIKEAYAIQQLNIERQLNAGARQIGHKVGLTSEAIQAWLKVDEPDFGVLLDTMLLPSGATLDPTLLLQGRAEAELAFILAEDLEGPGLTAVDVLRATEFVLPAIEIIDSRIKDWELTLEDTVADNASSGLFVLGCDPIALEDIDLRMVGMCLRRRGRVVSTGAGAACLGNPAEAVAWLANKLSSFGQHLSAGSIVLSGALGPAVPVAEGDWFEASIGDVGTVSFRVGHNKEGEA